MKLNSLSLLLATAFISLVSAQDARASVIYANIDWVYVCGHELNEELVNGETWETAIGYRPGNKNEVYLAAGWPAFPKKARSHSLTSDALRVEGYAGMDTFIQFVVNRKTTMQKVGNKKYAVTKALNTLDTYGADDTDELYCIYYKEVDPFASKKK